MRVLVTGGHGFIGAHVLLRLVEAGHDVTCLDIAEPSPISKQIADDVTFVRGDISDPATVYDAVIAADADRIIHLAGLLGRSSQHRPRHAFEVNVDATFTIFEAASSLGVDRVILAASAAVYGDVPSDLDAVDETVVRQPQSVYGLTKMVVEDMGSLYRERGAFEFAAIEPVHGLGPDRRRGNIQDSSILKAAVAGVPLAVPAESPPSEIVYVGDEAQAFVDAAFADELPSDRYLVGTGEQVTLAEFVDIVRERVPDAQLTLEPTKGEGALAGLPPSDTTRIRTELGWKPTHTIREAVDAYASWLEANPDAWSFDAETVPWVATD